MTAARRSLRLEPLEPRDAPAMLVSPTVLTYQDTDGDNVTVTFSRPILNTGNVTNVFAFDVGTVGGNNSVRQQLQTINLTGLGAGATGTAITVAATRSVITGGDGFAAVGHIEAEGTDLGRVTIDGDLGRIRAGGGSAATPGLRGLAVRSLGRFGRSTGAPDLRSVVAGRLGYLTVRSDVRAASVDVQEGDLGSVTIGGSLFGGDTANAGEISATGSVGPVIIKGDVIGSTGVWSGSISSGGALAGLTIGGSLRGGAGAASGRILGQGSVGPVRVGHDVAGAAGQDSGSIQAKGLLAGVTVGGSVTGGSGEDAGTIASGGAAGFVTIRGDLAGAGGEESGNVFSAGNLSRITVGGSVTGGTSRFSGRIEAMGDVGTVAIGRDLVGGRASGAASLYETGIIRARRIARLTLGGSLVAGTDNSTGDYFANGGIQVVNDIGTLAIRGSILGDPDHPAFILARGSAAPTATADIAIGRLTVRGRVEFAQIVAGVDPFGLGPDADAQIGAVSVGGDWIASSLAAGAVAGRDGFFGDADDAKATGSQAKDDPRLVSAIVRVTIGGQIVGTPNGGDHFGIVAEAVRAVSVAGDRLPLIPGPHNDDFPTGNTRDFTVRELPGP